MRLAYALSEKGSGLDDAFAALAEALGRRERRVVGAVQRTARDGEGRLSRMELLLLPEGTAWNIAQGLGGQAAGCRLDPGALEQATQEIARRLDDGADLLIVPRFAEREAGGGGFRTVMAVALDAGIPVIVGVSPSWAEAFEAFAGGLAEAVPPEAAAMERWLDPVGTPG